ncbi:hypothetical protein HOY80DRAFT_1085649, partial [Tuber brumale]
PTRFTFSLFLENPPALGLTITAIVKRNDITFVQVSGITNLWVIIGRRHPRGSASMGLTKQFSTSYASPGVRLDTGPAMTWSVIGRTLRASMWPSIFSADSAASRGARKRVIYIIPLSKIALIILAIAVVVTPLGLSAEGAPSFTKHTDFEHLKDALPVVPDMYFAALTNSGGTGTLMTHFRDFTSSQIRLSYTHLSVNILTKISPKTLLTYSRAAPPGGNLISGPFDVQYRAFSNSKHSDAKNSRNWIPKSQDNVYTIGLFETFRCVILDDNFVLVVGLIIDTKNGGVGIRNHSAPLNLRYGGTWEESLLWLEPVSQCVDNNITVGFTGSTNLQLGDLRSTDRRGWRTFSGAWMTNKIAALSFNLMRNMTSLGKNYSFTERQGDLRNEFVATKITIGDIKGNWMGGNSTDFEGENRKFANAGNLPQNPLTHTLLTCAVDAQYPGYWDDDMSNITNIAIKCSTIFGMAKRADCGEAKTYDAGAHWSMRIYTCATAVKASVEVVTLTMNDTHTVENLRVDKVVPTNYSSISVMPVWAMENSGMTIN